MVRSISSAILFGIFADELRADRVEELERAFPGFLDVDVGVGEPRVGHQKRGEREGHLIGIEPLLRRALTLLGLGLSDADQGHAEAVLVEVLVEAGHLEVRGQQDLVDVRLFQGDR